MVAISVDYLGDLRCKSVHLPSGAIVETDAPLDNHGKGELFSPTDLLAAAVGTCIATIMGIYAQGKGLDLKGMSLKIEKEMTKTPPRMISTLKIEIFFPIEIGELEKAKFERIVQTCPVSASLHPDIALNATFRWR